MYTLLKLGDRANAQLPEYYVESEAALSEIKNAPAGSTVLILTEAGLTVKMRHSSGKWVEI